MNVKSPIESLETFVDALRASPPTRERYEELLHRLQLGVEAIEPYRHFRDEFYTRNLIARTDDFELLTLCWSPGQVSPIHDHGGSDGWVVGMDGIVEEVWYQCDIARDGIVKWVKGRAARLELGGVGYINDEIAWHTVGNPTESPAVSLHLYAPPIDRCQYVDADTGRVASRDMTYFTVDGTRV